MLEALPLARDLTPESAEAEMDNTQRAEQDDCTCPWTDPATWTTYYGAVEPGSTREFEPTCPVHGCPDCKWRSVPDGQGGGDGEFEPCEKHAVSVDLAEVIENGWPDVATFGSEPF